jgi:hypothetical protein
MQIHELANILPRMSDDEFKALVDDIEQNGQLEAIWTYQGKIVDGRNRYNAILRLQEQKHPIEPKFREWSGKGSLAAFIYSQNYHRRHLDSSQKAAVSLGFEEAFAEEAQARMRAGANQHTSPSQTFEQGSKGRAAEHAAKATGTNRQYVYDAKKIKNSAPELLSEVRDGNLTIPEAKKVAELPLKERTQAVEAIRTAPVREVKKQFARELTKPAKRGDSLPIYSKWYDCIIRIQALIGDMGDHNPKDVALEIERWEDDDKRVYADRLIKAAKSLAQMYTALTEEEVFFDDQTPAEPFHYSN